MHGFHNARQPRRAEPATDFTDRRMTFRRELTDSIATLAEGLPPDDHALIRALYADGKSAVELARLAGKDPREVRRRARRLVKRILSPEYLFVLRTRHRWPAPRRSVAVACILHGRPQREVAAELRVPLYTVRRHCEAIHAALETLGAPADQKRSA
jgi:DNA-directed RNA polymerase specialized sigma24 family protein